MRCWDLVCMLKEGVMDHVFAQIRTELATNDNLRQA
jgi:hypothetical protein